MSTWGKYKGALGGKKSYSSIGPYGFGSTITHLAITTSTVWPSANLAIFVPVVVESPIIVAQLWWLNGAVAAGNVDIGIYASDGTRLVSAGSTAQSGVTAIQVVNITDVYLDASLYYIAMALSDASTATVGAQTLPSSQLGQMIGAAEMASALPLPAVATFASFARLLNPGMGWVGDVVL